MKKIVGILALGASMALGAGGAFAATCTSAGGGCGAYTNDDSQTLMNGTVIGYQVQSINAGAFVYTSQFFNQTADPVKLDFTVQQFQPTNQSSINNLTLTGYTDAAYSNSFGSLNVTNGSGAPTQSPGSLNDVLFSGIMLPVQTIYFKLTGTAVASPLSAKLLPSAQFTIAAVPVPAAGFLMLGGLAVFGFAARRKRKMAA